MFRPLLATIAVALLPITALAGPQVVKVTLKDGRVLTGQLTVREDGAIEVTPEGGQAALDAHDIEAITAVSSCARITIKGEDESLRSLAITAAAQGQISVIIHPAVAGKKVSLSLSEAPADEVLEILARIGGASCHRRGQLWLILPSAWVDPWGPGASAEAATRGEVLAKTLHSERASIKELLAGIAASQGLDFAFTAETEASYGAHLEGLPWRFAADVLAHLSGLDLSRRDGALEVKEGVGQVAQVAFASSVAKAFMRRVALNVKDAMRRFGYEGFGSVVPIARVGGPDELPTDWDKCSTADDNDVGIVSDAFELVRQSETWTFRVVDVHPVVSGSQRIALNELLKEEAIAEALIVEGFAEAPSAASEPSREQSVTFVVIGKTIYGVILGPIETVTPR